MTLTVPRAAPVGRATPVADPQAVPGGPGREPRVITPGVARRYLAIHQFLAPPRSLPAGPAGILATFERLGSIQFDPIEIAGRNHDLVLLARVADYRREMTDRLLYEERTLFETYNKGLSLVPTAELPWYRLAWDRARRRHDQGAFGEHAPLVEELLGRIREIGPMSSTDIEPRAAIDWYWRPTNQVRALLEALGESGILGLVRRDGNRRVYDLVERLFPAELLEREVPVRDRYRYKLLSRYRAHGLLGTSGNAELWLGTTPRVDKRTGTEDGLPLGAAGRHELHAELVKNGSLVPVAIEGIRGPRYVPAEELPRLEQAEREVAAGSAPGGMAAGVAFLAPLDPLIWDRDFLRSLYGFDYLWEVYVPAAKRRWGYYVLPIFFGDRLADRAVHSWWPDAPGTVREVRFAHSPGRLDPAYLNSLRDFDAAFVLDVRDRTHGIVGVDTEYHERAKSEIPKPSNLRRYLEVAERSGAFVPGAVNAVKGRSDLAVMWLEHLLLLSMLQHPSGAWSWGRYVVVHPAGNSDVADMCARYSDLLADRSTFSSMTLEELLDADALPRQTTAALRRRYLAVA